MTSISLLMGNYPLVTPRSEQVAVVEARSERRPLTFETIESEEAFARLEGWDALVRALPRPSPYLLHCWLLEWWRAYGDGCRLAVQVAFRGGELVGALPLITYSHRGRRILTFLGARQSALADALIAPDEGLDLVEALVDRLPASGHDYAELYGLPGDCRLGRINGHRRLRLFERVPAPVLDLHDGWEATYRAKTNARKRGHHKHRRRQLAALGEVEVECARTYAELEPALEEALRLHELRWRDRPDGSGLMTETGKRFSRAVLRGLSEIDVARIVLLKIDGRPIAFSWHFLLEQRVFLHRLAFDPAFGRFSPGLVNALDALQLAADEGAVRAEFLGGAERYKTELADRFEPLFLGLGLPGNLVGRSVVATRTRCLELRAGAKRSQLARKIYDAAVPTYRRVARPRDALRPSGVRRSGE
jgi:CelD/BcsL family acetyltransferase involved in cellulose biosynthesis